MDLGGPYTYGRGPQAPRPPNPFFDGTRLGLEGNMLVTLGIAIPAGLHIALSAMLGYSHFFSGKFYRRSPVPYDGDANFFYTQVTLDF